MPEDPRGYTLRLTTVRSGEMLVTVAGAEGVHRFDLRIVERSDGGFCILPELDRRFATLEDALTAAGRVDPPREGVECEFRWRSLEAPLGEDEQPCSTCAAVVVRRARYPHRLCPACQLEATDAMGRRVQFSNTTPLGGGLQGRYRETGAPYDSAECWVRGVPCTAEEDRFGGIVIQTREPSPVLPGT